MASVPPRAKDMIWSVSSESVRPSSSVAEAVSSAESRSLWSVPVER
ncbi:hypothetical protein AAHZ94_04125 [Streptomyces sp. HSW2009]